MASPTIGVIGGSGLYQMPEIERVREVAVKTPFGKPSDRLIRGRLGNVRIYRNHSFETGRRPAHYRTGTGMEVTGARTLELAGNVIERSSAGLSPITA